MPHLHNMDLGGLEMMGMGGGGGGMPHHSQHQRSVPSLQSISDDKHVASELVRDFNLMALLGGDLDDDDADEQRPGSRASTAENLRYRGDEGPAGDHTVYIIHMLKFPCPFTISIHYCTSPS